MNESWRKTTWNALNKHWDLIIVGGGITGAALLRRAVSGGLETLLVEANDFSSGTSSRSSKLVHGGFRYLKNRQWDITHESVREREWLLKNAPELVTPLHFALPYSASKSMRSSFALGVVIYDAMGHKWAHREVSREEAVKLVPEMQTDWLKGAFLYYDAAVDDCMLVNRLILESVADGGTALNYSRATQLLKTADGKVRGVKLEDQSGQGLGGLELQASVVVNATGPRSDELRAQVGGEGRIRPLRGSHLVFQRQNLPISMAVTIMHPKDHRAMFAIPWEGSTIIGTTDLDHQHNLDTQEPYCSEEETAYILEAANANFPNAELKMEDITSSFAGVRPIIHGGADNPSGESRRHAVFEENGLITITGGKLTIFRVMAEDTMAAIERALGRQTKSMEAWFKPLRPFSSQNTIDDLTYQYLSGRYGADLPGMVSNSQSHDFEHISSLPNVWAELKHAAQSGYVEHLDDLLLRRVRLGLLLPEGGKAELPRVKTLVQEKLGWDEHRWNQEAERYNQVYQSYYSPNPQGSQKG
ncbi:MAG TPA: glycerol-3-phosphate dehydrogenase/oxidase [Anaerolineaceae bacterium]|nr:glycerol-3-phosphate dehydrogenase/oxidase [Anaerolineaceae bacterium]